MNDHYEREPNGRVRELEAEVARLRAAVKALVGAGNRLAEVRRVVEEVEAEVRKVDRFPTEACGKILARLEKL